MCLAAIAIGQSARFPWVLLANRDEYFAREARALAWWAPQEGGPAILGGRDLSAGGTWLGLNQRGRLALLTNVREPGRSLPGAASRGELVSRCLTGPGDLEGLQGLAAAPRNGYNLLTADLSADPMTGARTSLAWWLSNRPKDRVADLAQGLYGLSNAALDTPWPKLQGLKRRLAQALSDDGDRPTLLARGFAALADPAPAPLDQLPQTGLPPDREQQLSSAFIHIRGASPEADYGTRCSTVVIVEARGPQRWVHVTERSFDRDAGVTGEVSFSHLLPASTA